MESSVGDEFHAFNLELMGEIQLDSIRIRIFQSRNHEELYTCMGSQMRQETKGRLDVQKSKSPIDLGALASWETLTR
jgi:hypothetical protein